METGKIRDALGGRISRRDFGKALAAAGVGLAAMPLTGRAARAAGKIEVLTWAGYDAAEYFPAYMEKYGELPGFSLFGSEEEALQKMLGGLHAGHLAPLQL